MSEIEIETVVEIGNIKRDYSFLADESVISVLVTFTRGHIGYKQAFRLVENKNVVAGKLHVRLNPYAAYIVDNEYVEMRKGPAIPHWLKKDIRRVYPVIKIMLMESYHESS